MNFKNITIANALYNSFSNLYLVENRGIGQTITETEEKNVLLPLFAETLSASKGLVGESIANSASGQSLVASGICRDVSVLIKVLERAVESFLINYNYSTAKLFTLLSAKPQILYQVCLLTVDEFYKNYRVDSYESYSCVIVDLYEEEAKREGARKEEARIQSIIDDWNKAEHEYVSTLKNNEIAIYYKDKMDGYLPECLQEAYLLAKPYLKS